MARGLSACYVPGVMFGTDLVGFRAPTLSGTANVSSMTIEGPGLRANAVSSGLIFTVGTSAVFSEFNAPTETSLFLRGYQIGAIPVADPNLFGTCFDAFNTSPFQIFNITVSGTANYAIQWNSGGSFNSQTINAVTTAAMVSLGATGKVGGNTVRYFNGVNKGSSAFGASAPTNSATSNFSIGAHPADASRQMNMVINIAIAWNRQLTDAEMAWLHIDPYGFLVPEEYTLPVAAPIFYTLMGQAML